MEEDISKTTYRCPNSFGTFHDFIDDFMLVYIDDVMFNSKSKLDHF